jgi:hypothetical protein
MQAGTPYQLLIVDMSAGASACRPGAGLAHSTAVWPPPLVLMNRYGAVCEPDAPQADAYLAKPLRAAAPVWSAWDTARARGLRRWPCHSDDACVPRILVVEDNRTSQTIATGMLAVCWGTRREVVANGRRGARV